MASAVPEFLVFAALIAAVQLSNSDGVSAADASAAAASHFETSPGSRENEDSAQSSHRQREGTRVVKQEGYFRATGDRLTFHLRDSELKYAGLENLALERIGKVLSDRHDHPEQLLWEVSGVFTEYRGTNYLLITHAILKDKSRRRTNLP